MVDFGGGEGQFTTWDGEPISQEPPHGATIVVASRAPGGWRYVLLHRAHRGPAWEGDWAWTPPSGSRKPGEEVAACATRELREETGLRAAPRPVAIDGVDWAVSPSKSPEARRFAVDHTEHDRFEWAGFTEAHRRCQPAALAVSFITACAAAGFS